MKLLEESFSSKGGAGHLRVIPETGEDVWQIFNLVRAGDHVTASTFRKVTREASGGLGAAESERVRVKLRVLVELVEYDGDGEAIRVKGRNTTESPHVKLGAYHTLDLDVNRTIKVEKEAWDVVDVARLREAADPAASADVAVLLVTEGLANLQLVGGATTTHRAKIEKSMPRKRGLASMGYEKALEMFHKNVLAAVLRHVDFAKIKCLVVAGPGFEKETFARYVDAECSRLATNAGGGGGGAGGRGDDGAALRALAENKSRLLLVHASTAFKGAVREVLEDPSVMARVKDTKAATEVRALNDFFETLASVPERAFYGPAHVFAAHEMCAIDKLLITDALLRDANAAARRRWVTLVEEVNGGGGTALIFSSQHESGRQLGELTGVAATLRFPLPDLADAELPPVEF